MTITVYKKGERPKARVTKPNHSLPDGWEVTKRNSKTTYMRHPYIVGECAFDNEDVEIVRAEGQRRQFIVTFTSMVIEADDMDAAIERAAEMHGGGNWDAEEVFL